MFSCSLCLAQKPSNGDSYAKANIYVCFSKGIASAKAAFAQNPELEKLARKTACHLPMTLALLMKNFLRWQETVSSTVILLNLSKN